MVMLSEKQKKNMYGFNVLVLKKGNINILYTHTLFLELLILWCVCFVSGISGSIHVFEKIFSKVIK